MSCYREDEWNEYFKNNIPMEKRNNMTNHLENCEVCEKIYFDTVDKNIMPLKEDISKDIYDNLPKKDKKYLDKKALIYIAASIITVILYTTGVFQYLITIPKLSERGIESVHKATFKLKEDYIWRINKK